MVKGVRHCSARRACHSCVQPSQTSKYIYMDYVSTVIKMTSVVGTD